MRILICPDKFKECLTASDVAFHIRKGILNADTDADCKLVPMADGGEGTVEALVEATGGNIVECHVHDPLMRSIKSFFGITGGGRTAVIEMSAASGLALLKEEERDPLVTTTYGTGELIRHALDRGCREIILGIGGSATVDGGIGMAQALGVRFTDAAGREVSPNGGGIGNIVTIDAAGLDQRLKQCRISAACDVTNPLTGPQGAAHVFGPQKGATPGMVRQLEANLRHLAGLIRNSMLRDVELLPGSGAAGGMGAGITAFLGGELKPGFELISQTVRLEEWIGWADLVITGEGRMDHQTGYGKTPAGVSSLAKMLNKPVIAFTGALSGEMRHFKAMGFETVIPIADKPMTLSESMADACRLLENAAERVFLLIRLGNQSLLPSNRNK